jgi:hypothetical protein
MILACPFKLCKAGQDTVEPHNMSIAITVTIDDGLPADGQAVWEGWQKEPAAVNA